MLSRKPGLVYFMKLNTAGTCTNGYHTESAHLIIISDVCFPNFEHAYDFEPDRTDFIQRLQTLNFCGHNTEKVKKSMLMETNGSKYLLFTGPP